MQKPFTVLMDTNLAGLTCQLCDNTGHAAKSCTIHLNADEVIRASLAAVAALEADLSRHQQRLAALDDQVKGLIKDVLHIGALYDEAPKSEQDEEEWDEYLSKRIGCIYAEKN